MPPQLEQHFCRVLNVPAIAGLQTIQSLWSGCGQVARVTLAENRTIVIKHIQMPDRLTHPRGWDTDRSAQRKIKSYEVETNWYARYADRCPETCRVPKHLGHAQWDDERLLILEDIDAAGYDRRLTSVTPDQLTACIRWLANFHANFLGHKGEGLWDKGTYWHLDTRPDEFAALEEGPLKRAARAIDTALDATPFHTLLHGDAKLANFCFAASWGVAAVDFQYVGPGCGMKDLAYLVGSCLTPDACAAQEAHILDTYFATLRNALAEQHHTADASALEADWRRLYPFAWADFERFLQGWSPGHWKISAYSKHMTKQVLAELRAD